MNDDNASSDGNMSDYDFVSDPEDDRCAISPRRDNTVRTAVIARAVSRGSSPPPPKGWSTLDLSDGRTGAGGNDGHGSTSADSSDNIINTAPSTATSAAAGRVEGPLGCMACGSLLRDCVECPGCHSLFCREHLRIDKLTGKSPCPCEPCSLPPRSKTTPESTAKKHRNKTNRASDDSIAETTRTSGSTAAARARGTVHPSEAFLPNIPVQRMADAVPSLCNGCGVSLSWGDLASHACDLQTVPCEHARWGCGWKGRRQRRADHEASSTCPGKLACAEHALGEARAEATAVRVGFDAKLAAELAAAREATESVERRATAAEMRAQELEMKIATAENVIKSMEVAATAAAAAAEAKLAAAVEATTAATATALAYKKKAAAMAEARGKDSSTAEVSNDMAARGGDAPQQQQHQQQQQQMLPTGFGAMLTKAAAAGGMATGGAGFLSRGAASPVEEAPASMSKTATASLPLPPAVTAAQRKAKDAAGSKSSRQPQQQQPQQQKQKQVVEAACQAPVPATEACLRPYLERPHSLLEKRVVVFWPRYEH